MSSPSDLLVLAYLERYNRLRAQTGVSVGLLWDRFARLDDDTEFAERAARLAVASQDVALAGLVGYLAALLVVMGEQPLPPSTVAASEVVGAAVRNGAQPVDVYRRGVVTARTAISKGKDFASAMAAGRSRMVSTAETDIALTQRAATVRALSSDSRIVGYRRVLTGKSCALCATASTQRYRTGQLMPIHSHCDCGIAPIVGTKDPGHVINRPLLDDLKKAGKGTPDAYYKNRRVTVLEDGTVELPPVAVREHGELGPVLTDKRDHFTGGDDLAA